MTTREQTPATVEDEAKLVRRLIRHKLVTERQLQAALDYQRSLGGDLAEVVVKLGLVRSSQMEDVLAGREPGPDQAGGDSGVTTLDPETVNVSDLKVHRRLLDKVPRDLVEKHLLITFFPAPSGNSRRIVLGHGREIQDAVRDRVRTTLGVDLCSLALDEKTAEEILSGHGFGETKGGPGTPEDPPEVAVEGILRAVVSLLVKKGILTREELEEEIQK